MLKLLRTGPELTSELITGFEKAHGIKVPAELASFWHKCGNGGYPEEIRFFLVDTADGEEEPKLHGVYGIGHPDSRYDLGKILRTIDVGPDMLPFAFDDIAGNSSLDLRGASAVAFTTSFGTTLHRRTFVMLRSLQVSQSSLKGFG